MPDFPSDTPSQIKADRSPPFSIASQRIHDPYLKPTFILWIYRDNGNIVIEFFNKSIHRHVGAWRCIRILPSKAFIMFALPQGWDSNIGLTNAQLQFIKDNISTWNAQKTNDVRQPLPTPIDLQFDERFPK